MQNLISRYSPVESGVSRWAVAAAVLMTAVACDQVGDPFCDNEGCGFSREEWKRLESLTGLPDPPANASNKYWNDADAAVLGHRFFFDTRFSGPATGNDAIRRPVSISTAGRGQPAGVSCASCHDLASGGADTASVPGHVSVGGGWTDVNALPATNSAYHMLPSWSGKADSLWGLTAGVSEGGTTMNGNRLALAYVIADNYRADYDSVFATGSEPFPFAYGTADIKGTFPMMGACPAGMPPDRFREVQSDGKTFCWPRFPLQGKPGTTAGCQAGSAAEPNQDAFDCMDPMDQARITRVLVNHAKAIEAFMYKLTSRDSAFDRFVAEGPTSKLISPEARRGARLFVGKASCIDCHSTPLFSDGAYRNIGVPQVGVAVPTVGDCPAGGVCDCSAGNGCLPWGAWDGLKKLAGNKYRRDSDFSDNKADTSRSALYYMKPPDNLKGTWRTPSLRDVALTAPYMHDGAFRTLDEVIWYYDSGGANQHSALDATRAVQIKPLSLTAEERRDLVEFLQTLNGAPLAPELTRALPPKAAAPARAVGRRRCEQIVAEGAPCL